MKQSEAIDYLEKVLLAAQKTRSNIIDENWGLVRNIGDTSDPLARLLLEIHPVLLEPENTWIMGLIKTLDRCQQGEMLPPQTFYNFLFLAQKEPAIGAMAALTLDTILPEPDIRIIANGWEAE